MIDTAAREGYWDAVATSDPLRAGRVAADLVASGTPLPTVLDDLVAAAQLRVGDLWAANEWSVAREHAATAVGEHVVRRLRRDLEAQATARRTGAPLLMVCAEKEWHALPALLLTTRLEHAGHRVVYLGPDVSTTALQIAIDEHNPRATLVSASLSSSLFFARRHVETSTSVGVPVVVGGAAFDPGGVRAQRLGATAHAASASVLARRLPDLPARVRPAPPLTSDSAREAYALVPGLSVVAEALVSRARDGGSGAAVVAVADQVPHLLGTLVAALLLDDPAIMAEGRSWLRAVAEARPGAAAAVDRLWEELGRHVRDFPQAYDLLRAPGETRTHN
ncbi:cobalamin-dependent protein [Nocardioides zeae]|uniref:Cobalamin-dependent protein n=1 Tax=Nocardioides imazamoxiresistens TaxID=3231893 RepID=A0ABU3PYU6_9ACTN|nr:cobalamin-dependent protein [Nocardioides zeae]MDT9594416.1 cobalamin-dependent protein [Nocardioides zeae]